ncbi:MAG: hypothetical protein WBG90_18440 [Saonia sp.]
MNEFLTIAIFFLAICIAYLLYDRFKSRTKIKTKSLEIGDFEITIENGELNIKPKK